ncbi:MAG: four helix bundle protein [Reichenbachiella sp.]|uniref:four helix bundle protein n=1 Tax=Reichenbachiella sp. TaxID=2184521 RepID=UPI003297F307
MHNFKELEVWNKAMALCTEIYKVTESFPNSEKYGLISQINRSRVSIPSNIAEGAGRNGNKEFNQFIGIALASSFELETQLIIAKNINYIEGQYFSGIMNSLNQVQKMLVGFKKSLNR